MKLYEFLQILISLYTEKYILEIAEAGQPERDQSQPQKSPTRSRGADHEAEAQRLTNAERRGTRSRGNAAAARRKPGRQQEATTRGNSRRHYERKVNSYVKDEQQESPREHHKIHNGAPQLRRVRSSPSRFHTVSGSRRRYICGLPQML